MTGLNLHALAASVVAESPSPDPDAMVAAFVAQLDPADYREAITLLARDLIRGVIRHQREGLNGGVARRGSRKVDAAREAWKRLLDSPEYLPSTGWIFLRDATHDQVLEMASVRAQKSRELAAAAKQYRRIAETMAEAKAKRVGDLPDDTLEQLLAPASKAVKAA